MGLTSKDKILFKYNGTPAATDVFLVNGDSIDVKETVANREHKQVGSGGMNNKRVSYDKYNITAEMSLEMLVEGTGAKGTPPAIDSFLKAAGHTVDVVADTSVTYIPHFNKIDPSTAIIYKGGSQKTTYTELIAAMSISGSVGESLKIKFDLQGRTDMLRSTESLADSTIEYLAEFTVDYITAVTVGGTEICLQSFELAQNSEIKSDYFVQCRSTSRKDIFPSLSLTELKAMNDPSAFVDFLNQTHKAVTITCSNADGEIFEIKADNAQPKPVEDGADDGTLTETRPYDLKNNASGIPYTLTYK
jgi:hypothetical protein